MKRLALILTLILGASFAAVAQNNAYAIDDECFVYFTAAEHSVDDFFTDAFETAQQSLLETSLRKKDTKAQTLYYVEQLKHTSHLAQYERLKDPKNWDWQAWNNRIEQDRETLQRVAKATGYSQYYYYAAELCQTYYFNTSQDLAATAMLHSMMTEARESGDEYAMWKALMYLGKLYQRISDKYNTNKILLDVVSIYENTQDPMILRQRIANQYCELADTYPVASESARLLIDKAESNCATEADSIRVTYYKAQLAAWDGNIHEYRLFRDFCLSREPFPNIIRGGDACFKCIDAILEGKNTKTVSELAQGLYLGQQTTFLYSLAEKRGQWETASRLLEKHVDRLYADIYNNNSQRIEETSARYGNEKLSADLARASQKVIRITVLVAILLTILLVGALLLAVRHIRSLKRAYDKDEALLADMKEKE